MVCKGFMDFPGNSVVENPPATQETWVPFLAQQYPLEKEMATPVRGSTLIETTHPGQAP